MLRSAEGASRSTRPVAEAGSKARGTPHVEIPADRVGDLAADGGCLARIAESDEDRIGEPRQDVQVLLRRGRMVAQDRACDLAQRHAQVADRGIRPEERRVGKEWVRTCSSRWGP